MNLTPPKFVAALRRRDRDDLIARLHALADRWDTVDLGASESMFGAIAGEATYRNAAVELRKVLDSETNQPTVE